MYAGAHCGRLPRRLCRVDHGKMPRRFAGGAGGAQEHVPGLWGAGHNASTREVPLPADKRNPESMRATLAELTDIPAGELALATRRKLDRLVENALDDLQKRASDAEAARAAHVRLESEKATEFGHLVDRTGVAVLPWPSGRTSTTSLCLQFVPRAIPRRGPSIPNATHYVCLRDDCLCAPQRALRHRVIACIP